MAIDLVDPYDAPRSWARIDYRDVARRYNALPVGLGLRLRKVTNITHFKRALERRGIREGQDYDACQRGRFCYLQRCSATPMSE